MNKNEEFTPIDLKTWKRREIFYYFSQMAPTGYSITAEVDITAMRKTVQAAGKRFFPAYLWLVTKCLMKQEEFKIAEKDGILGYYETLTPLYAAFHHDDKTFSLMWTEYHECFNDFHEAYLKDKEHYGDNHGILAKKDNLPPSNAYTVSSVPWIEFKHFAVHSYDNKPYYFPSVEAGKFYEKAGRLYMPLSLTCHHATTDGYHIKEFLKDFQDNADRFEKYL